MGPQSQHGVCSLRITKLVLASAVALLAPVCALAQNDPDLPNPPSNFETIPAGSYIIPMDTNWQSVVAPFNMRSYGLVNALLQTNIPVKWAIRAGKTKDAADFTGNVSRIYPSALAASNRPFFAGPFIVHKDYTNAAWKVITNFANSVAVFVLNSNTTVDIRYTLGFKPYIAVLNDGNTQSIHYNILIEAGITNYAVFSARNLSNNTCYSFASEPHYEPSNLNLASGQVTGARTYLLSGGNFLSQCAAVNTYENNTNASIAGRFQTTKLIVVNNVSDSFNYPNPDLAFSQIQGELEDTGGSVRDWRLATGSAFTNNAHAHVQNRSTANTNKYVATVSKYVAGQPGALMFYLGGHDYAGKSSEYTLLNGRRMYLNALFHPSDRPWDCGLNFMTDVTINKTDFREQIVEGMTNIYYITVTNLGPTRVNGVQIVDTFPPEITTATWTVAGSAGVVITNTSGAGNVSSFVNLPVLGSVTVTVRATIGPAPSCMVSNSARLVMPNGTSDANTNNNTAYDISDITSSVLAPPTSGVYTCMTFLPPAATNQAMFEEQGGRSSSPVTLISETNNNALGTTNDPFIVWRVFQAATVTGGCVGVGSTATQILTVIQNEAMPPDITNVNVRGTGARLSTRGTLISFDANDSSGALFDTAPDIVVTHLGVSNFTWNGDVPLDAEGNPGRAFGGTNWVEDDRYFGFTITVSNDWRMIATNILFDYFSADDGPLSWVVRCSVDSFVTEFAQGILYNDEVFYQTNGAMNMTLTPGTYSFRIYCMGGEGELRMDDVAIQGIVEPVPGSSFVTDSDLAQGLCVITADSRQVLSGLYALNTDKGPEYSLYTPLNVGLIQARDFTVGPLTNGAYKSFGPLTDTLPPVNMNNIVLGVYTAVVMTIDYTIPCPDPIPRIVREPITVTDDDSEGPTISGVSVSPSTWTNSPLFTASWSTNVSADPSGFHEFRVSTNLVAPTNAYVGFSVGTASSIVITNWREGITTSFVFAVDADDDRPNDRAKGNDGLIVMMFDQTPPGQVSGLSGTNGPDVISEVTLSWNALSNAGNRQSDNEPLSPWYSYLIFYTEGPTGPTVTDAFISVWNGGPATLGTNTTTSVIISNLFADTEYRFKIAGMDRAGNIGQLSEAITLATANFIVTQGVARSTSRVEVAWKAAPEKQYDVLYVDAPSFADGLTNAWTWMTTVTNQNLAADSGGSGRCPPNCLNNTLRFYRVSQKDTWQTWNNPRRASREVYASKAITLRPGENWVSLCMEPDTNKLAWVFGTNQLPSGVLPNAATISWYSQSTQSTAGLVATCIVWLANSGWQYLYGGEGPANDMKIPLYEGFNIQLPPDASPQALVVIGKVPTIDVVRVSAVVGNPNTNVYNLVNYNVPRRMRIDELGLKEAGLKAGPNVGFADEIRILDNSNGDGTMRAPKARIFLALDGTFRRVSGTSTVPANNYIVEPDEALIIIRRQGNTIESWTNRIYYSLPTKNISI